MKQLVTTPLVEKVIGCAIAVHKSLGPGLLESPYEQCLVREFAYQGMSFLRQVRVPLVYREMELTCAYRVDFIVENCLLVELKTVDRLLPLHQAQVLTYLRLLEMRQGLLMNFNVPRLVDGLRSVLCPVGTTSST